ncbi:hypothetical protein SAMN00017477_2096 [Peptoniphilus asaccharolyticus DSM 20463]|uniref:Uncharacterized protein n=1 Tax=Peptoniphilus asaccharolyticus DSM 20463 TaxID=573058 RepID=A0A1W1VJP4_PEPAS|nr:hypothetical protein [Peptoniphilus asaccharolyticus]MBL7574418.1 hypothetical protein [Peptoniphilus asaccharolyticus]SMB93582.1 hypothetical protein SAMN00017477_2096 [Peptoniphilus asaccharolyticus DSM 20463]
MKKMLVLCLVVMFASINANVVRASGMSYENGEKDDYTVVVGYDEKDRNELFSGLTEKEKEEFLSNKTKEIFQCISEGEINKVEKLKKENPKLTIIVKRKNLEDDLHFLGDNKNLMNVFELKDNEIKPYSYDTDTYTSNKYFRVSNDSGLAYAECRAQVKVDRNLVNKQVTIVGINVSVDRSSGKFGFNPIYNGNNTARIAWAYLGIDGYGNGTINVVAYFDKNVELY